MSLDKATNEEYNNANFVTVWLLKVRENVKTIKILRGFCTKIFSRLEIFVSKKLRIRFSLISTEL